MEKMIRVIIQVNDNEHFDSIKHDVVSAIKMRTTNYLITEEFMKRSIEAYRDKENKKFGEVDF